MAMCNKTGQCFPSLLYTSYQNLLPSPSLCCPHNILLSIPHPTPPLFRTHSRLHPNRQTEIRPNLRNLPPRLPRLRNPRRRKTFKHHPPGSRSHLLLNALLRRRRLHEEQIPSRARDRQPRSPPKTFRRGNPRNRCQCRLCERCDRKGGLRRCHEYGSHSRCLPRTLLA